MPVLRHEDLDTEINTQAQSNFYFKSLFLILNEKHLIFFNTRLDSGEINFC